MLKYLLCWCLLALVAIVNAVLREFTYGKVLAELIAHQISTVTAIILTGSLMWWINRVFAFASARQALLVGLIWFSLTIAFEFSFGHFVAGHSWDKLFADYNIFQGRVWSLFLIWILFMPYIFYQLTNLDAG